MEWWGGMVWPPSGPKKFGRTHWAAGLGRFRCQNRQKEANSLRKNPHKSFVFWPFLTFGGSNMTRRALWTWTEKVNFWLSHYLVLHDVLYKNHSGMHTYFQRFPCLNHIFRIFFNLIFDGISAILLIKTSHNVTFLVIYKKIQEMLFHIKVNLPDSEQLLSKNFFGTFWFYRVLIHSKDLNFLVW